MNNKKIKIKKKKACFGGNIDDIIEHLITDRGCSSWT
jgi:hypothetical protein